MIRLLRAPAAALLGLVLAAILVGCGADVPSFDPTGPCTADGQAPGSYPDLEALLPTQWEGQRPKGVDSGRTCTADGLGTLAGEGISELRFAGATWDLGGGTGFTIATFRAPGLDAAKMMAFYKAGAQAATRVDKASTSETTVGGRPAQRLDVLMSDGTGQTIVTWPSGDADRVQVLLSADLGDARVLEVLQALGSG